MAKAKKRATAYKKPLKVNATFKDVVRLAVGATPKPKPVKPPKKSK